MKVKRDWTILHYSEFNYMQTQKHSNIFQFHNQDEFRARDELYLSFLHLGPAQKESWKICYVYHQRPLELLSRKGESIFIEMKTGCSTDGKPGNQMHSFTFGNEFVYMSDVQPIFQHSLCFMYLPPTGLRKSRDLPISSIDLIPSGHLKTFTSFLQGLKSLSRNGTRDSHGHPEHSSAAQRGQRVPMHNPGTAAAQPKQHGGFHQLKFMDLALRCFLVVHPAVHLSWEVCYTSELLKLTMTFTEIFRTIFSSRRHKSGSWICKPQLLFVNTIFVDRTGKKKP